MLKTLLNTVQLRAVMDHRCMYVHTSTMYRQFLFMK